MRRKVKVYDFALAVERVAAAAQVARSHDVVLTARTENFVRGRPDLDDTIKRLQAFEKAGADVLMAPGLPDLDSVRKVCAALSKPFNFMAGIKGKSFSVPELQAAGVKRVSLATSLWRMAMSGADRGGARSEGEGQLRLYGALAQHAGHRQVHARIAVEYLRRAVVFRRIR